MVKLKSPSIELLPVPFFVPIANEFTAFFIFVMNGDSLAEDFSTAVIPDSRLGAALGVNSLAAKETG